MSLTVFAKGELGEKIVDKHIRTPQISHTEETRRWAYPIAGYNEAHSIGIGLAYESGDSIFHGYSHPGYRLVITSYRAMKILELVREFRYEKDTLDACWYLGHREIPNCRSWDSAGPNPDNILAEMGDSARQRILNMVPENLDDIVTMLQGNDIDFDGWEIEEEVKNGVIRVSPKIQSYLDGYQRKCELNEELNNNAEFGKLIPVEHAEAAIRNTPYTGDFGKWFLQAYNQHVDPNTRIAIRHHLRGLHCVDSNYIIGKSKTDKIIEITINGGVSFNYMIGPSADLEIALTYDGNDVKFQPRVPNNPKYTVRDSLSLEMKYGAVIRAYQEKGEFKVRVGSQSSLSIPDKRVEELANEVYQSIQTLISNRAKDKILYL